MAERTSPGWQNGEDLPSRGAVSPEDAQAQLERILASPLFRKAPRHSRFLSFVVNQTLSGEAVKESLIGLEVFDREPDYDPGSDPVVRVEAGRLRSRLTDYYQHLGQHDPIHIDLPKGTYVPAFHRNGIAAPAEESATQASSISARPENIIALPNDGAAPTSARVESASRLRWALVLGVIFCLAVGYGVHMLRARGGRSSTPTAASAAVKARRSIAVIGFANLSQQPNSAWLSRGLSVYLTTELGAGGKLMIIPDETVARAKAELKIGDSDGFSPETLARIRNNLGADLVLSGAYTVLPASGSANGRATKAGDQLRVDLRLQNAVTGEMLPSVSEAGNAVGLFDLVTRMGTDVRQNLGVESATAAELAEGKSAMSSDPTALRLYSEGIDKLHNFDALRACDLFELSVKSDPKFALAHSALAEAWLTLGYDERAEQEAKTLYELSGELGREQRLFIEGRYREAARQWKEAITAYSALFAFFPDNVEYGLRLARAQREATQFRDALDTAQTLKRLAAPASQDPRIDLEEARAYSYLAEAGKAKSAAMAAQQKAAARGQRLLSAQVDLFVEGAVGGMLWGSGGHQERLAGLDHVRQTCEAVGDLNCAGQALLYVAEAQENEPSSLQVLEQAREVFTRIGNEAGMAEVRRHMGVLWVHQGKLELARVEYGLALAICDKTDNRSCVRALMMDDGNISYLQGDMPAAAKQYREVLNQAIQAGETGDIGWALSSLAEVEQIQGNLDETSETLQQLAKLETDARGGIQPATQTAIGGLECDQGRLHEARTTLERASAQELGPEGNRDARFSLMALATVDLAEKRPAEAEKKLRPMADFWEARKRVYWGVPAFDLLAQALLAQNKLSEAQAAIRRGGALLGNSPPAYFALHFALTAAQVDVAAHPGDSATTRHAMESVHRVMTEAQRYGMGKLKLEARLVEGGIEVHSGEETVGRSHLEGLEHDAAEKGFNLISREASRRSLAGGGD